MNIGDSLSVYEVIISSIETRWKLAVSVTREIPSGPSRQNVVVAARGTCLFLVQCCSIHPERSCVFIMRKSTMFSPKSIGASIAMASILAVPATMAFTGVAGAQTGGGDLRAAGYLPDADLTSNLTIHKKAGAESGIQDVGTEGQESVPADATPLEGVTFQVDRVDVDLTQREGWDAARQMTPEKAATQLDGSTSVNGVTDENGILQFSDLPLGMYLVTETNAPQGVITGQPFLVYLPMTVDSDGDGVLDNWNQDVHVYPKNSKLTLDKEVTDTGAQAGDIVNYKITGTVPTSLTEENSTIADAQFEFHDFLDAENAYVGEDQAIELTIFGGEQDGTVLVEGEHYVVIGNDATAETPGSQTGPRGTQHIKVTLTDAGLQAIIGAGTVQMTMEAVVKPVADTDGITFNFVRQLTNDGRGGGSITTSNIPGDTPEEPGDDPDPEDPTPGVETYHGQAIINKIDGDSDVALEGAEFALYASAISGLETVDEVLADGEEITVNGQDRWVTNADGTLTIDGIHASDFADNAITSDTVYYYLVETEAPDGYVLLDVVVPFELFAEDAVAGGTPMQFTTTVENVTDENFLPLTGGAGILGLLAAGGLLVGSGVAYNRMANRDKDEDVEADVKA